MADTRAGTASVSLSERLYEMSSSDPKGELVDRTGVSEEDLAQIARLMAALVGLRDTEREVAEASREYMQLGAQDMRGLHFLIVAKNRGEVVTPGMLASHLKISAASTTKLLNRLERGGHITRSVHPVDRRAFAIEITPETQAAAMQTVGKQQAKRFISAARLTPDQRETVISFLEDMTDKLSLKNADWAPGSAAS
ncbi:Transcriptional regulator, MarR family [Leucobacter sp. 7(1)]|uniref:MarR family winged helix-turn-helix transcriptional regulator n=1 Tax=Leucobacter sp. 7(1) TaxID=1255613 RepID=UPI00097F08BD|nr:MarR family transcriptional regulator [Leucobacter sp. 7(1)]SJN10004.1 Transcriptional regulator, MarR family [Leucobacter sp. 7(1)]